ncbi:MAG: response regulator [Deltaproteobacteria bacterium]|nr:response regulator [Deltaproteobacteria bacterium]
MQPKWPSASLTAGDLTLSPSGSGTTQADPAAISTCVLSSVSLLASALHILVAEDDPTLGEALAGFLHEKGHRVDWARTGREALRCLEQGDYSLLITDLVMPGADGLAVLRASRCCDPPPLVVIMTGYASIDSAIQAIREGAYDYLRKPFKLQEIEIAVANAGRLLSLHRENQKLLQRLRDLTAQLEHRPRPQMADSQPNSTAHPRDEAAPAPPLSPPPWGWNDIARPHQADLDRLHHLYKESLLTEKEYHLLKQRLLI